MHWLQPIVLTLLEIILSKALTDEEIQIFRNNGVNISHASDTTWLFEHHGVPDHDHGPFPSRGNPNTVTTQDHEFRIPKVPTSIDQPVCLSLGPIGMAISGAPFFNPYSAQGYDAVGGVGETGECSETFDDCQGHPQNAGMYHYHQLPSCLFDGTENQLLGVALDGHPIYGPIIENGVTVSRSSGELDICGGRVYNGGYRYHITYDFPYILGCYHSMVETRRRPQRQRRHVIQKRQQSSVNCINPADMSWLPCYADCANPILGCPDTTTTIRQTERTTERSQTNATTIQQIPSTVTATRPTSSITRSTTIRQRPTTVTDQRSTIKSTTVFISLDSTTTPPPMETSTQEGMPASTPCSDSSLFSKCYTGGSRHMSVVMEILILNLFLVIMLSENNFFASIRELLY